MKKELKEKEKKTLLNNDIPSNEVLLIDENGQKKIILKEKAIEKAKELGLDLICVSLKNIPPVCKILDYKKLLFDIKKKNKKKKCDKRERIKNFSNDWWPRFELKTKKNNRMNWKKKCFCEIYNKSTKPGKKTLRISR